MNSEFVDSSVCTFNYFILAIRGLHSAPSVKFVPVVDNSLCLYGVGE